MTRTSRAWAAGILTLSFFWGIAVVLGYHPGAYTGIDTFERLAALIARLVEALGPVLSGIGVMLSGVCLSALIFASGEGSPGFGDGSGDCGDGD